jgi:hypothetical protein
MKRSLMAAAALCFGVAINVYAQDTSSARPKPPVKDSTKTGTASGVLNVPDDTTPEWYVPTGTTCSSVDAAAAKTVTIKSGLYNSGAGMISPDSAKIVALCAVPGQIGSGDMTTADGRTEYTIDIIPNNKKTNAKVIVDANTGAVLSSKQFGGLRGLAGWVRESAEHKMNTTKPPKDTAAAAKPPVLR